MSINGTRGAPHHVEHWTIEPGLTTDEASTYVHDTFGSGDVSHPVGFSYGPKTGELELFFQVSTRHSKPLSVHAVKQARAAREEHRTKLGLKTENPVKGNVAQAAPLPEPVPEPEPDASSADNADAGALSDAPKTGEAPSVDDAETSAPSDAPKTGEAPSAPSDAPKTGEAP